MSAIAKIKNMKIKTRARRAKPTRKKVQELQVRNPDLVRLTVHRSPRHISVQAIKYDYLKKTSVVLAFASTMEAEIKKQCADNGNVYTGNIDAAKVVGKAIAERLQQLGLSELKVAFDRSGFQYHGRIKALADAARESGLNF